MKKRLLSLLLVVLIVLGALPMSALATGTDGTAAASTVIPINISQIAGTITGLKVEGVEVVDSKMEQGGAYLEQYITVYVAEADK
ncbi:MAG: hypothetical protein IJ017_08940, partial [Oscillospiraceae bacterium]|nr:hypothetical protein [Oscillospiraceae bacterium]